MLKFKIQMKLLHR